jgi:hypothetical protein
MLPIEVVQADHELETAIERDNHQLARHRWHWTLDESNPERVSISEYARQIGRAKSTILVMVNGYAAYSDDNSRSTSRTLSDEIGKARMSGETAAAAQAVADARGIRTRSASDSASPHANEVRRVRDIARQLAEEHGTSVEEEAPKVAETIVRHEQAEQEEQQEKAQRTDLRVIEAERHVLTAKRAVAKAIKALEHVEIDDEAIDILTDAHNGLKALSTLFDARLTGKSGTDWDAELAKLA